MQLQKKRKRKRKKPDSKVSDLCSAEAINPTPESVYQVNGMVVLTRSLPVVTLTLVVIDRGLPCMSKHIHKAIHFGCRHGDKT
jgi:hypothetical protein